MATDTLRIICPNLRCRAVLSVPGEARGKTVRCRQCGMRVRVPAPARDAASSTEEKQVDSASA